LEFKKEGMLDGKSGDDDTGEVRWSRSVMTQERDCRSRRGWRSVWGSWFQRWGKLTAQWKEKNGQ